MTAAEFVRGFKAGQYVHTSEAARIYGCGGGNLIRMAGKMGVKPVARLGDYDAQMVGGKPGLYWRADVVLLIRRRARERKADAKRRSGETLRRRMDAANAKRDRRLAKLKAYYQLPKAARTLGAWTKLTPLPNA